MKIKIQPIWRNTKKGYTYYNKPITTDEGYQIIKGVRLPKKDYTIKNHKIITRDIQKAKSIDRLIRKHLK